MPLYGEAKRAYDRQWVAARRTSFFNDKKCATCGSTKNLELDHIDPKTKITNSIWSWSTARREEELLKCQILCNPCHKKKTVKDLRTMFKKAKSEDLIHGGFSAYSKHGCRCDKCREYRQFKYTNTGH